MESKSKDSSLGRTWNTRQEFYMCLRLQDPVRICFFQSATCYQTHASISRAAAVAPWTTHFRSVARRLASFVGSFWVSVSMTRVVIIHP